jgi:hypothetical protein
MQWLKIYSSCERLIKKCQKIYRNYLYVNVIVLYIVKDDTLYHYSYDFIQIIYNYEIFLSVFGTRTIEIELTFDNMISKIVFANNQRNYEGNFKLYE